MQPAHPEPAPRSLVNTAGRLAPVTDRALALPWASSLAHNAPPHASGKGRSVHQSAPSSHAPIDAFLQNAQQRRGTNETRMRGARGREGGREKGEGKGGGTGGRERRRDWREGGGDGPRAPYRGGGATTAREGPAPFTRCPLGSTLCSSGRAELSLPLPARTSSAPARPTLPRHVRALFENDDRYTVTPSWRFATSWRFSGSNLLAVPKPQPPGGSQEATFWRFLSPNLLAVLRKQPSGGS